MKDCRIRHAVTTDLSALARMRRALQECIKACDPVVWRLSPQLIDGLEQHYAGILAQNTNRIFLAVDETDRPVGMLMVRILDNPNIEPRLVGRIDDAWVEPDFRHRGIMRALTETCCRFLKERNVPVVTLDWAVHNQTSVYCWRKLGFEPRLAIGFTTPAAVLTGSNHKGAITDET